MEIIALKIYFKLFLDKTDVSTVETISEMMALIQSRSLVDSMLKLFHLMEK